MDDRHSLDYIWGQKPLSYISYFAQGFIKVKKNALSLTHLYSSLFGVCHGQGNTAFFFWGLKNPWPKHCLLGNYL